MKLTLKQTSSVERWGHQPRSQHSRVLESFHLLALASQTLGICEARTLAIMLAGLLPQARGCPGRSSRPLGPHVGKGLLTSARILALFLNLYRHTTREPREGLSPTPPASSPSPRPTPAPPFTCFVMQCPVCDTGLCRTKQPELHSPHPLPTPLRPWKPVSLGPFCTSVTQETPAPAVALAPGTLLVHVLLVTALVTAQLQWWS